ncbi:MAG: hypothetical protein Ct9H90mP18_10110 [Gammaproteobacteria bacterium]|nr:MAG: hypothetical protein Ct9H90mP18_10110 [Gammaproteobacteria bacterium]
MNVKLLYYGYKCTWINHKTAPIEIREKLVLKRKSAAALTDIKKIDGVNGVILLSTCKELKSILRMIMIILKLLSG